MSKAFTEPFTPENKDAPLSLRKNIRDNEEKLKGHLDRISKATGKTFSTRFIGYGPKEVNEKVDKGYQDRIGEILASYLDNVAQSFEKACKDEMTKEAICEATEKNNIVFEFVDKKKDDWKESYFNVAFKGGEYVLGIPLNYFWSNIGQIASKDLDMVLSDMEAPTAEQVAKLPKSTRFAKTAVFPAPFSPDSKELPMMIRKSFVKNMEKATAAMDKINKATGKTWKIEMKGMNARDFEKKTNYSYKDRTGEILTSYLENLAALIEKACKDDMVKEGLTEKASKDTIVFDLIPDLKDGYYGISFAEDKLVLTIGANKYWYNVGQIASFKIENLL